MNQALQIQPDAEGVTTVAAETLKGDMIAFVAGELRALPDTWSRLSQERQQEVLDRLALRCDDIIDQVVSIVCNQGFDSVRATVESVTFKNGVKAVLQLGRGQGAHDLADSEGDQVLVVFADTERFQSTETAPAAEPNQAELLTDKQIDNLETH